MHRVKNEGKILDGRERGKGSKGKEGDLGMRRGEDKKRIRG